MQGIFRKENTDKALKYGIYRHLPTYEKIIRNLVSFWVKKKISKACLKNHSRNLHAPICGIFCLHSVDVTRYTALIQAKSPTNCNAHLTERGRKSWTE